MTTGTHMRLLRHIGSRMHLHTRAYVPNVAFHSSPQDDAKHDARPEEVPVCLNHLLVCSCEHNSYEGIASGINNVSVLD